VDLTVPTVWTKRCCRPLNGTKDVSLLETAISEALIWVESAGSTTRLSLTEHWQWICALTQASFATFIFLHSTASNEVIKYKWVDLNICSQWPVCHSSQSTMVYTLRSHWTSGVQRWQHFDNLLGLLHSNICQACKKNHCHQPSCKILAP